MYVSCEIKKNIYGKTVGVYIKDDKRDAEGIAVYSIMSSNVTVVESLQ